MKLALLAKMALRLDRMVRVLVLKTRNESRKNTENQSITLLLMAVQYLQLAAAAMRQFQKDEEERRRSLN